MKIPALHYYDISPNAIAFSSTRHGGYGNGNYKEFNINLFCGDSPEAISKNKTALCRELGIEESALVFPHQIHQTRGVVIDKEFLGLPESERKEKLEGFDYIATQEKGICIGVSTADCVPVLLYFSNPQTIAAIHAGWRGTLKRITLKAVEELKKNQGVNVESCRAIIGPSISREAFEVGDEVYESFQSEGFDMPSISTRINGKWHIDLWKANVMQLESAGICAENIRTSGICTYYNNADYFSARRQGINSGRIFSGILIKQKA